jgi:hypothetical protein
MISAGFFGFIQLFLKGPCRAPESGVSIIEGAGLGKGLAPVKWRNFSPWG